MWKGPDPHGSDSGGFEIVISHPLFTVALNVGLMIIGIVFWLACSVWEMAAKGRARKKGFR